MRHRALRLLTLLPCLLLAAGCRHPAPNAPSATPAAKDFDKRTDPPQDGYFRWRLRENPPDLDPAKSTDTTSAAVVLNVFDGLVEFEPLTLEVRPAVASSWTVSDDGLVYTFQLRDNVLFHNGRKVTAEDVRWSFERTLSPDLVSERRWVLEQIAGAQDYIAGKAEHVSGIEVVSPTEVRLTLSAPLAPFLGQLCMEAGSIIPKEVYEDPEKGYLRHPVGCGPFAFQEWQQSNFLKLKAFDGYYRGRPKLNGLSFRFIESMVTAVLEYKNGGLELVDEIPPGQRKALAAELPGQYVKWPHAGVYYLGFNQELPPFKGNAKLRQAFNHAVDRKYICEKLQEDKDIPAYGILPPGIPGHRPETTQDPYDPEKAKQLLAEAGYPGGKGLEPVVLYFNTNEGHARVAQQVQADLAKIGVKIELSNSDWATYLDLVEGTATENAKTAFYRMGWIADYPDPDNFMTVRLSCDYFGPKGNYDRYCNPKFEELIDRARTLTTMAERIPLYQQAEQIAIDDAVWLFIYYYGEEMLLKPYVKGFALSPQGDYTAPMAEVSFEGGAATPS